MTYPNYTQQALSRYNLPRLKRIAVELGITPTGDKRAADTWINAIITHQSAQVQKLKEQTTAQAELDHHIATQAQAIANVPLTTVEISFEDHELYAGFELVAAITHDDDLTQPWVVMVNGTEKFRANTWMRCYRYISWHHQDGTLEEALEQGAGSRGENLSPLHPAPCPLSSSATSNEIMAQIFNECEKYGFALLDDGIYTSNCKLGKVGCTEGSWWVIRAGECQQMPCDSAMDAVWWLSMVDTMPDAKAADYEELLDRPFEMLTAEDWQRLREYEPVTESRELVPA
ncbi:MAG: hypothetical protein V7K89_33530 [Nostoc sp.]|uniref:hypothetical protein n=1 Tax=Nostoc sp. TaxID=1180 RepID=UPI002FFC4C36